MSDYIDLIAGKPLEPWAEQAMKDRASSKAGAVERAREVARDLRLRLSAMGINLTDDARTAINRAVRFAALPASEHGNHCPDCGKPDQCVCAASEHGRDDIAAMARFLIDRIDELDWCDMSENGFIRDWHGHVDPPLCRLRAALQPQSGEAGA